MKKLTNKKGFTLMEMLIVIAIIVILVAVAVPSFTSSLDKANKATDDANMRTAKSLAMVEAINPPAEDTNYYFDLATGELKKGDATGLENEGKAKDNQEKFIRVKISKTGEATLSWEACSTTPAGGDGDDN